MNQRTLPRKQRIDPVETGQGGVIDQTATLETVLQQAGYSLGNDLHAFYNTPIAAHDCALCRGRRTCAGNQSVRKPVALRSPSSIRLN